MRLHIVVVNRGCNGGRGLLLKKKNRGKFLGDWIMGKGVILGPLKKRTIAKHVSVSLCPLVSPALSHETETGHFLPYYNHQLNNTPKPKNLLLKKEQFPTLGGDTFTSPL